MSVLCFTEADVWAALSRVIDPELDCDIVSLGLVYEVVIDRDRIAVTMTLTAPGCPMSDILPAAVKSTLEELPGVEAAQVDLVWHPRWSPSRLTTAAREKLGVPADA